VTVHALGHVGAFVPRARTRYSAPSLGRRRPLQRVGAIAGDLLALGVVVFCIPFVILAVGIPVAGIVQLLLWVGRLL
jgi:hypothetical protein